MWCAARETPIFSPEFLFRSISFSQITKKSVLHFLADFAVPETIIFKIALISTRSSPWEAMNGEATAAAAAPQLAARNVLAVPATRIFTLKMDQARSGAPHYHAQNGSSSFRSPAFSRSTGSLFRSPGPFLAHPVRRTRWAYAMAWRPSVLPSVRPSVLPSFRPSTVFKMLLLRHFSTDFDSDCFIR